MSEESGRSKLAAFAVLALSIAIAWYVPVEFGEPPQDDAYISYIYARNFARGEGLVFNAGEPPVEGYTNFLWTVLCGYAFKAGIDPEPLSPKVGLGLTLLTVLLTFALARRWGATRWFAALAALLFATRPTLTVHAMGGMETPLFGLLVVLAMLARSGDGGSRARQWTGSTILALAALTRPEGVLFYGLFELASLGLALRRREQLVPFFRDAVVRALPFLLIVGAHVAWRRVTYGDWVPNTFHAKVEPGPITWADGLRYVSWGLLYFGPFFLLLPWLARFPEGHAADRGRALFLTASFTLYILYVGGDYIPSYRFLWPVMPLWAAMMAASASTIRPRSGPAIAVVSVLLVAMMAGHTVHEYRTGHRWSGLELRHRQLVESGKLLDRILPEDTWIAVTAAGRIPYYADRRTLDMMGLADAHIGKRATMKQAEELAGHLKGDGKYVLDEEPDLILFLKLMLLGNPLAQNPGWREIARTGTFGVSERELVADPRFFREYRCVSIPLPVTKGWLNVFARDGAFGGNLPPGSVVSGKLE